MAKVSQKPSSPPPGRGTRQYPASSAVQEGNVSFGRSRRAYQAHHPDHRRRGPSTRALKRSASSPQPGEESLLPRLLQTPRRSTRPILSRQKTGPSSNPKNSPPSASAFTSPSSGRPTDLDTPSSKPKQFRRRRPPSLLLLGDPHLHLRRQGPLRPPAHQGFFETLHTRRRHRRSTDALKRQLHLFGTIRGNPVDAARGLYKAELIIEKPTIDQARAQLATPGLPAGNYLSHFGHTTSFSPAQSSTASNISSTNKRPRQGRNRADRRPGSVLRPTDGQILGRHQPGPSATIPASPTASWKPSSPWPSTASTARRSAKAIARISGDAGQELRSP